jgi:hypothetical protein
MNGSDHPNTPGPFLGRAKSASGTEWRFPFYRESQAVSRRWRPLLSVHKRVEREKASITYSTAPRGETERMVTVATAEQPNAKLAQDPDRSCSSLCGDVLHEAGTTV